jgi:hypothetical protein
MPVRYLNRDFSSIKEELVSHARQYYPETFKDFSEVGFGSMMMDMVSYVGDQLSFYVDYQANESFLGTASEFENVVKLAKQVGYRFQENPSSHGIATFFVLVPANSNGLGPDNRYIPILKKGTILSTNSGNNFTLNEDVHFDKPENEVVVGQVNDTTGVPTSYAIKGYGRVISGALERLSIPVGEFQRFLKIPVNINNLAEIVSVVDSEGNDYYEVDFLSQDVVYRGVSNKKSGSSEPVSILRPFMVPRRYTVEREQGVNYLQFGYGTDSTEITSDKVADPSAIVLKKHGRDYVSDATIDPTNLVASDKFGVVPANTTLEVTVRVNSTSNVNAGVDTITEVVSPIFEFEEPTTLNRELKTFVRNSLECTNEEPVIGDVTFPSVDELKKRVQSSFAAQNRAVTREDYKAMVYRMPPEYGAIKRVNVIRDMNSFKRNINVYVVSEDATGKLTRTNETVKNNLKVWINKSRMINDTVDILDAYICNMSIDFEIIGSLTRDKFDILADCQLAVAQEFSRTRDIGEPFFYTDVYNALNKVDGVVDVVWVKAKLKTGGLYSDIRFSIMENTSSDGTYISIPNNVVFEIKYPDSDIGGVVK